MPSFRYESLTTAGENRAGILEAPSRADAVRRLLDQGQTATTIAEVKGVAAAGGESAADRAAAAASPVDRLFGRTRPTLPRAELASFVREIATAIEAGLPLMSSLRTVRKQAHGRAMPVILDHLIERVEAGDPLYAAARDYGQPFDDMVVGMMRAADASGEMSEVLHQLADLLERSVELRREVRGATFYPAIVMVLLLASVIFLVTFLVPRLIGGIVGGASGDFNLPWPTAALMGTADFVRDWWWLVIGGIGALFVGWRLWLSAPQNRVTWDRSLLRIPVVGRLMRDAAVARFTRTLGTLTSAGLPILEALRITKATLGNVAMMNAIGEVEDQVTAGKSLADPLDRSGLFPALLVQVVSLGERSGRLDQMLLHAATAFDRQVQTSIKLFTKAIPPFLLVIMAGLGGFVLAAILLPLLELQSMVG